MTPGFFLVYFGYHTRVNIFLIVLYHTVEFVCYFTVRTMSDEDGSSPTPKATGDSEGSSQPNNMHVDTELPNYLINISKKEEVTDFLCDVSEDEKESGLGYDSDGDADEVLDVDIESKLARLFRLASITDHDANENIEVDNNMVEFKKLFNKNVNPESLQIHCVPDDWQDPPPDVGKDEPPFESIDNPGEWSSFSFRPVFKKSAGSSRAKYQHHCLPTGCVPVEKDANGKRTIDGWEFFYKGWDGDGCMTETIKPQKDSIEDGNDADTLDADSTSMVIDAEAVDDDVLERVGVEEDDLFPESRLGSLDADVLRKLGLTSSTVKTNDFLFFLQLILPMCDPHRSGINGDDRLPYYSKLEEWSNLYACQIGLGGSYGHEFKNVSLKEILHHDGCIVRDGVRGGSSGAIYRRWQIGADYDDHISMALSFRRWLQIKRVKKLCNNDSAIKNKDSPNYDPTYKYDYIFKCIINNVNYLTMDAELDCTIDETTYATASPGESGAGVTFRIMGKPNVSKGGQTVLLCDAHRVRPRAYYHRHKVHSKPEGWTASGMIEARRLLEKLEPMVDDDTKNSSTTIKKIYSSKPHVTMDNYFSGDRICEWIGQKGFGATMTCRRDRLPSGVPAKYWHKQRTDTSKRTKVARFFQPIVAVKKVEATENHCAYRRVNVSFQSTSSCNISTVNALSKCGLTVHKRERGVLDAKRT